MTNTPTALIVAHGQPSDPGLAEAALTALCRAVAGHLPGWHLRSATLAAPGALDRALEGLAAPAVLPFFMAEGWFTRTALPRRLRAAGAPEARILPAFGSDPAVEALAETVVRRAAAAAGWPLQDTVLVLVAHGSRTGPASALATARLADRLRTLPLRDMRLAFIEEPPFLDDVAALAGPEALCLPLFVAEGGHVTTDIPAALVAAGFTGRCLPPLGTDPAVPSLIAALLRGANIG